MCCKGRLDKTSNQRRLMDVLYWAAKEDGKQEGKEECLLNPHHSTTLLARPSNPLSTYFHHFPMCMRSKMHGHPHLIILLTDIPITTIFSLYTT
uniref:Uncharacterized protein n=1 Tax=Vitis vinifera TaxID=29760 RepID=F6H1V0_VITVI